MGGRIILQLCLNERIKFAAVDCLLFAPLEIYRRKQTMSSITCLRITKGSDLEKWHNAGMLGQVS